MRSPHKLAAVMFADIAGYSAIMAKNEELAMEKLSIFKITLKKASLLHSGKVIQYFGDGCLMTFDSSVQAVECAVAIQNELGKGSIVPVRIGIHTGDVVFKDGNVYGDAVNIASRIESIAQPGTIFVSNPIRKQVKSTNKFEFASLGKFDFKNIDEPVEVYALSNLGFVVPTKGSIEGKLRSSKDIKKIYQDYNKPMLWVLGAIATLFIIYYINSDTLLNPNHNNSSIQLLRNEGITIFPIVNETGDASYNNLQCYFNRSMTSILVENNIEVYNRSTLCLDERYLSVLRSQIFPSTELTEKLNSKYGLEPKLLLQDDKIQIDAEIQNLENAEGLFTPISIVVPKGNAIEGIYLLIDEIVDLLDLAKKPDLGILQMEWEEEYKNAISFFGKDYDKVLEHLSNCKKIDSTRYEADILALEVHRAYRYDEKKIDSILNYLAIKESALDLSEDQANLYKVHVAIRNNNYTPAVEYYKKEYEKDPVNLWINFNMISHAVQLVNDSEFAVQVGNMIDDERMDYHDCDYCKDRLTFKTRALIEQEKYEDALKSLENAQDMELDTQSAGIWELQFRALVRLKDEERLKEKLELSKFKVFDARRDYDYFLYTTAYEYHLTGDSINTRKYYEMHQQSVKDKDAIPARARNGRMQIFLKEYDKALQTLKGVPEYYNENDWPHFFDGYYGYALARSGIVNEALTLIKEMEESKKSLNDDWATTQIPYYQAQVYAGLGDIEQTLKHLLESLAKGKRFYRWEFQYDPLFIDIYDDDRFRKLIYKQ